MDESRNDIQPVVYERIVVPLDGSALAECALPHATTLARAARLPIHLLRVVDLTPPTQFSAVGPGPDPSAFLVELEIVQAEEAAAEDYLELVRRRLADQGLSATAEVRTGMVISELTSVVRPGDVLVMTTHGRTGLERLLFGSVAEAMIRHSPAPVLLMRSTASAGETAQTSDGTEQFTRGL
jgi:nucleotide-binding universal stress UspA family protein